MAAVPQYEIYAIRYGTTAVTTIPNFVIPDPKDGPMSMDFFFWVIRGDERTIIVDTGFDAQVAARRRPDWKSLHSPLDALREIGVDPAQVRDVVLTHLDWDHAGNTTLFPKATFHLQEREMAFSTGRFMTHRFFSFRMELDNVLAVVRNVYEGRVKFYDGTGEVGPGISLHLVGGHTGGLQVVRVHTRRGWVVLASDAVHYWANIRERRPFPLSKDLGEVMEGFSIVEELADGPDHIIPGHDPLVLTTFSALPNNPDILRLDVLAQ
jgi:glyoxylase-like metal-dependent hydrolase (beta-lactamase superfamily II)